MARDWRAAIFGLLSQRLAPRYLTLFLIALAVACPLLIYQRRLETFTLVADDFDFVLHALSWDMTLDQLWRPHVSHWCPLFRLLTGILRALAGRLTDLCLTFRLGPICALLLVQMLMFAWARGETDSSFGGLLAAIAMGFTSVYSIAVDYYSASQSLWALAFTLLGLTGCAAWCRAQSRGAAVVAVAAVAMAPAWWSAGILAGPICSLYLWLRCTNNTGIRRLVVSCAPLAATVSYLAVVQVVAWQEPLIPGFGGRATSETFRPLVAVSLTIQSVVEKLLLGNLGVTEPRLNVSQAIVLLAAGIFTFSRFTSRQGRSATLAVAVAFVILGYLLPYSFRGHIEYTYLRAQVWYAVFPQAGWSLLFPAVWKIRPRSDKDRLYFSEALLLAVLAVGLAVLHWPVVWQKGHAFDFLAQRNQLAELELIQAVSTRYGVNHAVLGEAIGPFRVQGSHPWFDGLTLLSQPAQCRNWEVDEVRVRLRRVLETGSVASFEIGTENGTSPAPR
jgi:hypothetical protein